MTRIYIRHARKAYKNGQSYNFKHDPGIIDNSLNSIYQCCAQLIKLYGLPSVIICSPYRRTRETAFEMKKYLDNLYNIILPIPIYCDTNISEYLGNHANDKLDVTPETIIYKPPHPEKWKQFNIRISTHNKNMKYLDDIRESVWFITHGLIVSSLAKNYDLNVRNISPLGSLIIQQCKASYIPMQQSG